MRLDSLPTLGDSGLMLRPIELTDVPSWYRYLAMPHVIEHTSWNLNSADDLEPIIRLSNTEDLNSAIRFAIVERSTNMLVGTIGFPFISMIHRTAELAYDLHPDYWGEGIASLCSRALIAWIMTEHEFIRVQATVLDTNLRSVRVLKKIGFELEGHLKKYRIVRGEPRDYLMFSVTN
ncbi:GNAT family N-acetyltransferase [Undibacterium sp. SXout11W]|uniref:GNAT family N-acetyltransferase n=1 Tax=Undibacterium sp. SXout11W TaxID=3413050 RepID=UPI003BEF6908